MPCFDAEAAREREEAVSSLPKRDAMLCAVLAVLDKHSLTEKVLAQIDSREAGVTAEEIASWHRQHLAADNVRRHDADESGHSEPRR